MHDGRENTHKREAAPGGIQGQHRVRTLLHFPWMKYLNLLSDATLWLTSDRTSDEVQAHSQDHDAEEVPKVAGARHGT